MAEKEEIQKERGYSPVKKRPAVPLFIGKD